MKKVIILLATLLPLSFTLRGSFFEENSIPQEEVSEPKEGNGFKWLPLKMDSSVYDDSLEFGEVPGGCLVRHVERGLSREAMAIGVGLTFVPGVKPQAVGESYELVPIE